jgi:hypothetical protein
VERESKAVSETAPAVNPAKTDVTEEPPAEVTSEDQVPTRTEESPAEPETPERSELAGVMETLHSQARESMRDTEHENATASEEEEADGPPEDTGESDPDKTPDLSYGRARSRRGPRPTKGADEPDTDDASATKEPVADDGYSVDEVPSFGRGRKKSSRR